MCPPRRIDKAAKPQPPTPGKPGARAAHRPKRKGSYLFHAPVQTQWGRLVIDRLEALGMTAAELSRRVGVSKPAVYNYLDGRVRPPLDDLEVWARILEVEDVKRFHRLALMGHAPAEVSGLFARQEEELLRLARVLRELTEENLRLRALVTTGK